MRITLPNTFPDTPIDRVENPQDVIRRDIESCRSFFLNKAPRVQAIWVLGVGIEAAHREEELARAEEIELARAAQKWVEAEHREAERKDTERLETKLADADRVAAEHRAREHSLLGIPLYILYSDERKARAADKALHENIAGERVDLEREVQPNSANRADKACEF